MVTLRYISLALSLAGLGVWLTWAKRNPGKRWYAVAPLTWLANVAAFYTARVLALPFSIETINIWSSTIHLHALILAIGGGFIYWRMR